MSNTTHDQIFDFNAAFAELVTKQAIETPEAVVSVDEAGLNQALQASGEAAYRWTIETDELIWSSNVTDILGCPVAAVSTGKLFSSLLDVENVTTRYETVMNGRVRDGGKGVPFQIEYMFRSQGRANPAIVWIEDVGRWRAGPDGIPKVVYGTVRRVDERHLREQHLSFIGNCDPLTGMMNRGRMTEVLGEAITVAAKTGGSCAFAIAAINNLPLVNEAYGFHVADEVIVQAGRRLRQVMRGGDGISRYSGGKFGIILNDCNEEDLEIAMKRYLTIIRDNVIETGHGPVWAALSIGAIVLPHHAGKPDEATARAEEALNEAQKLPSDGYVIYKPSERRTHERELNSRCATEIINCLKDERFKLAYQPVFSAADRKPLFHEALLRMQDRASGELITASHLIPVAERLGLVRLVDRSVVQMVLQTLHRIPHAQLTMNISGTTATDPYWYDQILDMIRANEEAAKRLTVEITETVALNDLASTRRFVESLRKAGCGVAIDDFGSGFTSFRNLRELPVTMVKMDGTFCCDVKDSRDNEYVVRSLIDLARKLDLKTVAEWVTTPGDADLLTQWGADYLQGNYLGEAKVTLPWDDAAGGTFEIKPTTPVRLAELSAPFLTSEEHVEPEAMDETEHEPVLEMFTFTEPEAAFQHAGEVNIETEIAAPLSMVEAVEPETPPAEVKSEPAPLNDIERSLQRIRDALRNLPSKSTASAKPDGRDAA